MAIYNAWVDRVPILLPGGTGAVDSAKRRPWIEWIHTAHVQGNHIRDFVKFDDQPASVPAAIASILHAYRLKAAQPTGPVYVCLEVDLQEDALPAGTAQAAEWLAGARSPVILAGKVARSAEGVDALRALAESLAAPVLDGFAGFNFPSTHPLDATGANAPTLAAADVILKVISLTAAQLLVHSWTSDDSRI